MAENSVPSFKASDLVIQLSSNPKPKTEMLQFGNEFTDHMLTIEWTSAEGWQAPLIKPFGDLSLHPAIASLHYAVQLFEGLKVFCGADNRLRFFRPMLNMRRMLNSTKRLCLPMFNQSELLECIRRLLVIEQDWVRHAKSRSLYIRPTFISLDPRLSMRRATRALLYVFLCSATSCTLHTGQSLSLWADPKYTRAWEGGTGDCKLGANYGCGVVATHDAWDHGCHQVLWLYKENHCITEMGNMNIFLHWINEDGEEELATPPLDGIILPGVTRQSILELTRGWGGFKVTERSLTMSQLCSGLKQQRVKEMFGCGTALMIRSVGHVIYQSEDLCIPCQDKKMTERIKKELTDIMYGRTSSDWTVLV
ncbi:branched-chain-amino-acid aminotransferase, cytosolic [Brachionichthys hirsutus]|uniref:branched-chain-amino-acid aminotransferase, cytosolic n=1 Tax=Brachionichthys hirsutus TaxID=412623 RepID=UPI003604E129